MSDDTTPSAGPTTTAASESEVVPAEWGLLDAESQNAAFPDTFPIPTAAERDSLRTGDLVKLVFVLDPPPAEGPNAERMWVEVRTALPDGTYDGWLTNTPVVITSLNTSALVAFEPRHVAGIALRRDEVTFDVELKAVVSAKALDLKGPPGWAGFDEPLAPTDSGWSVTAGNEPADYFSGPSEEVTKVLTLGDLVQRYPALVEVFQAGEGEWAYRPEHRRYVRIKGT
ncbi:MAG: DUF2185 domain-containing protein [Acidimicrobiales bacterium]|nr:DUF2185 domain-containing protein [Acidimicrobiales bacterium]